MNETPPQDQDLTTAPPEPEGAEAVTLVEDVSIDGMCGVY